MRRSGFALPRQLSSQHRDLRCEWLRTPDLPTPMATVGKQRLVSHDRITYKYDGRAREVRSPSIEDRSWTVGHRGFEHGFRPRIDQRCKDVATLRVHPRHDQLRGRVAGLFREGIERGDAGHWFIQRHCQPLHGGQSNS